MAPRKEPPVESGDSRVTTRPTNANKHPGMEAVAALRVRTRRDPQVVQTEKEKKQATKETKEKEQRAEVAKKEAAQKDLEEFRAQQATNLKVDAAPRQAKGKNIFFFFDTLSLISDIGSKKDLKETATASKAEGKDSQISIILSFILFNRVRWTRNH